MRTFRFKDSRAHRFWQIAVRDDSLTVSSGKAGTVGRTETVSFRTPKKAQAEADKLIREKMGRGYKEITPQAPTPDAAALERGIVEHADEYVRWAVYSDYLTEQGDPRGEFMRVQLDLEDEALSAADRKKLKQREAELLAEYERAWLGPLCEFTVGAKPQETWVGQERVTRPPVVHRFERGWLAALDIVGYEAFEAFAACRDARLIRELVVNSMGPGEGDELIRCPHVGSLRSLRVGTVVDVDDQGAQHFHSDSSADFLTELARRAPFLESLEVYGWGGEMEALFALPLPRLRSLTVFHANSICPLETLAANATMANLTTIRCHPHCLELHYGSESGAYIGLKQLRAVCRSPHLTSLTHLCLRLTDFGDQGAEEIVKSGILKRLKVLDLYGGCISDEGAKALAACPDFKNLEFANLRRNALTADGTKALKATKVNADVRDQHGDSAPDFTGYRGPGYLYDGDIE